MNSLLSCNLIEILNQTFEFSEKSHFVEKLSARRRIIIIFGDSCVFFSLLFDKIMRRWAYSKTTRQLAFILGKFILKLLFVSSAINVISKRNKRQMRNKKSRIQSMRRERERERQSAEKQKKYAEIIKERAPCHYKNYNVRYLFWLNDVTIFVFVRAGGRALARSLLLFACIYACHVFFSVEWDVAFILAHVFINSNRIHTFYS